MNFDLEFKKDLWRSKIEPFLILQPNGCRIWPAGKQRGYGCVSGYRNGSQKTFRCHRVALEVSRNSELGELKSLHSCDNPSCSNPEHLFAGTDNDNRMDAIAKGRSVFGVKGQTKWVAHKKLSTESVREIRAKSVTHTVSQLAAEYKVSAECIRDAIARKTWAWVI